MKAYLAGPIFTERDRNFNAYLEKEILARCPDLDLYLAQNNTSINDKTGCATSADIYVGDVTRLQESDLLITIMSGDMPPIGSSYETAYFCGLCEQDPRRRIIALYDDSRNGSTTYSEAKRDAMLNGPGENQWSYINLLAVGYVKKWGTICTNSKDFIDEIARQYHIGTDKIISGIYKITNLKTGMPYIGQSVDIYRRWREHCNSKTSWLGQDINALGKNYFKFEILERCEQSELIAREQYWINYFESDLLGYNIQKISADSANNPAWNQTPVHCYTLDGNYYNTYNSIAEAARAINRSTAGIQACLRHHDNQHSSGNFMWSLDKVEKMESYSRLPHGAQKTIHQYDKDTRLYIASYDSLKDAAAACGYNNVKTHIPDVIKGHRKTCYGFLWAEDYFDRLPDNYYSEVNK